MNRESSSLNRKTPNPIVALYNASMGWACTHCGDVNSGLIETCEECGSNRGATSRMRFEPQPVGASLIWLATLLGGVLAGYAIAVWNGRVLRKHSAITTVLYVVVGIGGWVLTVFLIAQLTPPQSGEPGFGIPIALALSFLLVSIPYNRDTLAVNQWIWSHPARKLVLNVGGKSMGLAYSSFAGAHGELFGDAPATRPLLSVPVLPVLVIAFGLAIGVLTVILGNALAPK